jgi:uncharacterized protein
LQEIADKGADEIWFNPGSESPELLQKAHALGLNVITACSIVDAHANAARHPHTKS